MSRTVTEGASAAVDLGDLLLKSKVTVPSPRPGDVSRRVMIDGLVAGDARVVSVCAPAGFGKTTLLTEWASLETRAVGWVSVDASDDDAAALLALIARACATFSASAAAVTGRMGVGSSPLSRSAPLLATALAAASEDFVLFIDDAHLADSPECQDVLEVALARVPSGSQVVLASRHEAPLLSRMRSSGAATAVSSVDLCLDQSGARTVFNRAGIPVSDDDIDRIVRATEGWAAAVFLSAQIVASDGDAAAIRGDHRYVADYLYRECFTRLPDALQRFLRQTAVLEKFSIEACNAVTESDDAREMIAQIDAAHLFLVPIDRRAGWYRYHALFRQFLLTELERADGAAGVALRQGRAARWMADNGLPEVAVDHLLAAGDRRGAAMMVAVLAFTIYDEGRMPTIRRWLAAVGEQEVRRYPVLAVIAAWVGALGGDAVASQRWSHIVAGIEVGQIDVRQRDEFVIARATLDAALCARGPSQALADASFAVSRLPEWDPWLSAALHLQGSAHLLLGADDAARAAFTRAIEMADATGAADPAILSEPELALLALRDGRTVRAHAHAERGVERVTTSRMTGYPVTGLALAVGARLALRHDDVPHAKQLLARAMRVRADATYVVPFLAVRLRLQLAKAHVTLGERSAARHLLHEIDEIRAKRPDLGCLVDDVNRFRAVLDEDAADAGTTPLTPAELRLLPYLQTHLTIGEIGERLFVSRNTVSSEVSSIYRKLGATTRSGAVHRATSLGMLGD